MSQTLTIEQVVDLLERHIATLAWREKAPGTRNFNRTIAQAVRTNEEILLDMIQTGRTDGWTFHDPEGE